MEVCRGSTAPDFLVLAAASCTIFPDAISLEPRLLIIIRVKHSLLSALPAQLTSAIAAGLSRQLSAQQRMAGHVTIRLIRLTGNSPADTVRTVHVSECEY